MSPGGLKMAPSRLKRDAGWIQEASREPQAGPKWSHKGPKWNPSGVANGNLGVGKNVKILRVFT